MVFILGLKVFKIEEYIQPNILNELNEQKTTTKKVNVWLGCP